MVMQGRWEHTGRAPPISTERPCNTARGRPDSRVWSTAPGGCAALPGPCEVQSEPVGRVGLYCPAVGTAGGPEFTSGRGSALIKLFCTSRRQSSRCPGCGLPTGPGGRGNAGSPRLRCHLSPSLPPVLRLGGLWGLYVLRTAPAHPGCSLLPTRCSVQPATGREEPLGQSWPPVCPRGSGPGLFAHPHLIQRQSPCFLLPVAKSGSV